MSDDEAVNCQLWELLWHHRAAGNAESRVTLQIAETVLFKNKYVSH